MSHRSGAGAARGPSARGRTGRALVLVALLLVGPGGCGGSQTAIGVLLPRTGPLAPWGEQVLEGILMAWEELPVDQRPPLLVEDGLGTPLGTTEAFEALVDQGACVVLGPLTTGNAIVAAVTARALRVPFVTPTATGEEVTRDNGYALRFSYTDAEVARSLALFSRFDANLSRLAIVVDPANRWSLGLAAAFAREFQIRRGRIVGEVDYESGHADVGAVLDEVCALDVEGALIAGYHDDVVAMVEGARDPRLADLVLLGVDGWEGGELAAVLSNRVAGAFATNHFSLDEPDERVREFVERYTQRIGVPPSAFAALGYDTARAVFAAHGKAQTPEALRRELHAIRLADGVTGSVQMDSGGNPKAKTMVLEQLADPDRGRFVKRLEG